MPETKKEAVNHPSHYNFGKYEVIDVIEDWKLGFNLGNTVKYLARAKYKGHEIEDLKKAKWYLEREIARLEAEFEGRKPVFEAVFKEKKPDLADKPLPERIVKAIKDSLQAVL